MKQTNAKSEVTLEIDALSYGPYGIGRLNGKAVMIPATSPGDTVVARILESKNPTYEEVCSGRTGHEEVVRVGFEPGRISYQSLLRLFWENHDPTQGMRQGNDVGTQYRSAIYWYDTAQRDAALASRDAYQRVLSRAGFEKITTEIREAPEFYYAEEYHQQYLAKNPGCYCGLGGTGVSCPASHASAVTA